MDNCVKKNALLFFPDFADVISSDAPNAIETWASSLSTGKSLELCSLLFLLQEINYSYGAVKINEYILKQPGRFYLRNEIPLHHGAQAGHESTIESDFSLNERFIASVLPRASFSFENNSYMIFREGNPLHLLNSVFLKKNTYKDRPDLIIVLGCLEIIEINNKYISFGHHVKDEHCRFEISIKNSGIIPLRRYDCTSGYHVTTCGLIECSISKTKKNVDTQIEKYIQLFKSESFSPSALFINGSIDSSAYPTINISTHELVQSLTSQVSKIKLHAFLNEALSWNS